MAGTTSWPSWSKPWLTPRQAVLPLNVQVCASVFCAFVCVGHVRVCVCACVCARARMCVRACVLRGWCVRVRVACMECACACVCAWRAGDADGASATLGEVSQTVGEVSQTVGMDEVLPTTDQPYVDPLQELRVDMRRLLGQLEGRKVPLSQVNAEWKRLIDPEFDLKKYQMRKGKRQQRGLRQLLQCIPDTVNIVPALGPNARSVVEWAVLIDVAAS